MKLKEVVVDENIIGVPVFTDHKERLQLLNRKLKQLSPIPAARSLNDDDDDDGRRDRLVAAVSCENEDENEETTAEDVVGMYDDSSSEETECRKFVDHQSEIHEGHCSNSLMTLVESEDDKENEDGGSSIVQASCGKTRLGLKSTGKKLCCDVEESQMMLCKLQKAIHNYGVSRNAAAAATRFGTDRTSTSTMSMSHPEGELVMETITEILRDEKLMRSPSTTHARMNSSEIDAWIEKQFGLDDDKGASPLSHDGGVKEEGEADGQEIESAEVEFHLHNENEGHHESASTSVSMACESGCIPDTSGLWTISCEEDEQDCHTSDRSFKIPSETEHSLFLTNASKDHNGDIFQQQLFEADEDEDVVCGDYHDLSEYSDEEEELSLQELRALNRNQELIDSRKLPQSGFGEILEQTSGRCWDHSLSTEPSDDATDQAKNSSVVEGVLLQPQLASLTSWNLMDASSEHELNTSLHEWDLNLQDLEHKNMMQCSTPIVELDNTSLEDGNTYCQHFQSTKPPMGCEMDLPTLEPSEEMKYFLDKMKRERYEIDVPLLGLPEETQAFLDELKRKSSARIMRVQQNTVTNDTEKLHLDLQMELGTVEKLDKELLEKEKYAASVMSATHSHSIQSSSQGDHKENSQLIREEGMQQQPESAVRMTLENLDQNQATKKTDHVQRNIRLGPDARFFSLKPEEEALVEQILLQPDSIEIDTLTDGCSIASSVSTGFDLVGENAKRMAEIDAQLEQFQHQCSPSSQGDKENSEAASVYVSSVLISQGSPSINQLINQSHILGMVGTWEPSAVTTPQDSGAKPQGSLKCHPIKESVTLGRISNKSSSKGSNKGSSNKETCKHHHDQASTATSNVDNYLEEQRDWRAQHQEAMEVEKKLKELHVAPLPTVISEEDVASLVLQGKHEQGIF